MSGIVKRFGDVVANDGADLELAAGRDPRARRRERGRQVHPDVGPLRAGSRRTRARSGCAGRAGALPVARRRHRGRASAWCTRLPAVRVDDGGRERRLPGRDPGHRRPARPAGRGARGAGPLGAIRPRGSIRARGCGTLSGRRPAARRDPQGAAPRRPGAHPRRADRRAHPPGGPPAVRRAPRAARRRTDGRASSPTSSARCSSVSDHVTVLRDGRTVARLVTADTDGAEIARHMTGRAVDLEGRHVPGHPGRAGAARSRGSPSGPRPAAPWSTTSP